MKLDLYGLFAFVQCTLAKNWVIDNSCTSVTLKDGSTINVQQPLKDAMAEALGIATDAYEALERFPSDEKVQSTIQILLGGDAHKVQRAKATFSSLMGFRKEPSQLSPHDPEWRKDRTNLDVEFYCGLDRFKKGNLKSGREVHFNTAMDNKPYTKTPYEKIETFYTFAYNLDDPKEDRPAKAMTMDSDWYNGKLYNDHREEAVASNKPVPHRKDPTYTTPRERIACSVDFSPWHLDLQNRGQWQHVTKERIEIAMGEEFIEKFVSEREKPGEPSRRTPIDALVFMGVVVLHELTHTVRGGYLEDIPTKKTCYGWKCIQNEKDPQNADTITMLGLALRLWKLGYWVDERGYIHKIDV